MPSGKLPLSLDAIGVVLKLLVFIFKLIYELTLCNELFVLEKGSVVVVLVPLLDVYGSDVCFCLGLVLVQLLVIEGLLGEGVECGLMGLMCECVPVFGECLEKGGLVAQDASHSQLINDNSIDYFAFLILNTFRPVVELKYPRNYDDNINYHSPRLCPCSRQCSLSVTRKLRS